MYHVNEIPLDYEPRRKILEKIAPHVNSHGIEMSEFDSAFLCGLIKQIRPKKILEVGIAAGGTTSIILQALEDLSAPYEMHSVDILRDYWGDKTKPIGFVADLVTQILNVKQYHKHIGGGILSHLNELEGGFDFVILDTAHYLPGELLDFPVILQLVRTNAMVCLHDVACHQAHDDANKHATAVLFSTVTAEKYLNFIPNGTPLSVEFS